MLSAALQSRDVDMVKVVMQSGKVTVAASWFALPYAAELGQLDIVLCLLAQGVMVNPPPPPPAGPHGSENVYTKPALWVAVRYGKAPVAEALLAAGADPNAGYLSTSPLWEAVKTGNARLAGALLAAGADVDFVPREPWLHTALELAVEMHSFECVQVLLKARPRNLTEPFLRSVSFDRVDIIEALLEAGADHKAVLKGKTNISYAASKVVADYVKKRQAEEDTPLEASQRSEKRPRPST